MTVADESPFVTLVHEVEGVPVVKASGNLDLNGADRFRTVLEQAVERAVGGVMVVDLIAVEFMDSCGINALVGGTRSFTQRRGEVRLVVKGSPATRTIKLTGLHRIFSMYPDVASASGRGVA